MQVKTIRLDSQGVDEASEIIQSWLEEAGIPHRDVLRIRLTTEELLSVICDRGGDDIRAELRFWKWFGDWRLSIRYDGGRFDPTAAREDGLQGWTDELLSRTGFLPIWSRHGGENELLFSIPGKGGWRKHVMLCCVAAAAVLGLLGQFLPEALKAGISEYCLTFLSESFLHLLNTFIGILIFLSIVNGICGIGSAAKFKRIG